MNTSTLGFRMMSAFVSDISTDAGVQLNRAIQIPQFAGTSEPGRGNPSWNGYRLGDVGARRPIFGGYRTGSRAMVRGINSLSTKLTKCNVGTDDRIALHRRLDSSHVLLEYA
jgi:hypothetical protein